MTTETTATAHRNTVEQLVGNPAFYHRDGSRNWEVRVGLRRGKKESTCYVRAATRERALGAAVRMFKEWRSQSATPLYATPWPEGDDWDANAESEVSE